MKPRKRAVAAYHTFNFGQDRACPCGERLIADCRGLQGDAPRSGHCAFDLAPLRARAELAADRYLGRAAAVARRRAKPSALPYALLAASIVAAMAGSAYIVANLMN
ncbi:hypothetical protein CKO28_00540 [Rhodovibrio sodomensis]|uniref:Uncharacterized protein n=1 Tax=Rhodovibrio sodomensis TaxID=1088 RepID=A0ABS1DA98_9PROT|nr:hypothetical protein [Rhodovibrio sodomensis]MBK1666528.1 hypothetical protein [Rhodovibrio sodomensis]